MLSVVSCCVHESCHVCTEWHVFSAILTFAAVIKMTQCYFLIKKVNSNIANQTEIIYYKSVHFARVLKCCKSDQILDSHYQQQEKMLRQEKYEYKQVNMIWNIDFFNQ